MRNREEAISSLENISVVHESLGEEVEKLRRLLYSQSEKEEKKLKNDKVKTRFIVEPKIEDLSTLGKFKDLEDIFDSNISNFIYPLGPGEGISDLGKPVNIRNQRQLAIFNSLYYKVLLRGEGVFSIPTLIMRITPQLINYPDLTIAMDIQLNNQWYTGLNHLSNSLFALGHPPNKEAVITRYKFVGKTILWYRFTDTFLKEFSKQKSLIGFRKVLKKFGVTIESGFLGGGLGLLTNSIHPLLRIEE